MKFLDTVKAICADSFITSPKWPVSCNEPLDLFGLSSGMFNFRLAVSMYNVEPPGNLGRKIIQIFKLVNFEIHCILPIAVQANPITTPAGVSSYIRSVVNIGLPMYPSILSSDIVIFSASFLTILKATFLTIYKKIIKRK